MRRDLDKIQARIDAGETITALAAEAGVSKQSLSVALKRHAKRREAARIGALAATAAGKAVARVVAKEMRT